MYTLNELRAMKCRQHNNSANYSGAERGSAVRRSLVVALALGALVAPLAIAIHLIHFDLAFGQGAGTSRLSDCSAGGAEFSNPPEIRHSGGFLNGNIFLSEERQRLPTSIEGKIIDCSESVVRNFRPDPPQEPRNRDALFEPMPGPTLRARVGDLVQLTFVNQIDPGRFESGRDLGREACTQNVGSYPDPFSDEYPNCLHASSTANIHFHGTHTNPNSTGDNVYLQIRPLPRNGPGTLITSPDQARVGVADYFKKCTDELRKDPVKSWPVKWSDLPVEWTDKQKELLKAHQQEMPDQPLWSANEKVLQDGWPVYYIGVFPYCFALPAYTADDWPPPAHSGSPVMGQSPGTHWYHAHKHGSTAINVMNGMTGAFIIEGKYDDDLNEAYGSYLLKDEEVWKPWKASDARSQKILVLNQLGTAPNARFGGLVEPELVQREQWVDFSVNGRLRPTLKMQPGEVQLWRIVNTSGRTAAYFMSPDFMEPGGLTWRQIAQDGVQFTSANYEASENRPFYMAPANRVDLLVKAPIDGAEKTFEVRIQNVMARSSAKPIPIKPSRGESRPEEPMPGIALLRVKVEGRPPKRDNQETEMPFLGNAAGEPKFPERPKFLRDISPDELKEGNHITRTLVFNSKGPMSSPKIRPGPRQHTINDIQFDDEHAHLDIALGAVEEWTIKNTTVKNGPMIGTDLGGLSTNIDHPLHIHINPFQIAEFFDPNENLVDRKTGKLEAEVVLNTETNQIATAAVPLYVVADKEQVDDKRQFANLVAKNPELAVRQCYIDPNDKATWSVKGARKIGRDEATGQFTVSNMPCEPQMPSEWNSIWWDVFAIPSGRKTSIDIIPGFYKMHSRFVDYPGLYVMHCHILIHEDRGMMYSVEVLRRTVRPHH
jgi:FtsP/CotA-like multicopper oxidase with cupredoxin domain